MKSQNLKIENVKTSDLIPYIGNAKLHPEKQIGQIASSIKEFSFLSPVLLDEDNGIIAGHGRVLAAQKLKMDTLPCIRAKGLTPAQIRAYRIADNQLNLSSGWDYEILGLELDGLKELDFDLDVLGFEDLDFMIEPGEPKDAPVQIDQAEELNKKWQVAIGDLWEIGEHRLLCGDSTKPEDVEQVMGGEKAGAVVTDPPYGMSAVESSGVLSARYGSDIAGDKDNMTAIRGFRSCIGMEVPQVWWGANYYTEEVPSNGCWLVWDKNNGGSDQADAELAWTNLPGMVRIFKQASEKVGRVHPTQKHPLLIMWTIEKTGGEIVYDPFLGSGTTMVACENLNRKCQGIEISENYCAVILERMATAFPKLTIQKANQ